METIFSFISEVVWPMVLILSGFFLGISWDEIAPRLQGPENRKAKSLVFLIFLVFAFALATLYVNV